MNKFIICEALPNGKTLLCSLISKSKVKRSVHCAKKHSSTSSLIVWSSVAAEETIIPSSGFLTSCLLPVVPPLSSTLHQPMHTSYPGRPPQPTGTAWCLLQRMLHHLLELSFSLAWPSSGLSHCWATSTVKAMSGQAGLVPPEVNIAVSTVMVPAFSHAPELGFLWGRPGSVNSTLLLVEQTCSSHHCRVAHGCSWGQLWPVHGQLCDGPGCFHGRKDVSGGQGRVEGDIFCTTGLGFPLTASKQGRVMWVRWREVTLLDLDVDMVWEQRSGASFWPETQASGQAVEPMLGSCFPCLVCQKESYQQGSPGGFGYLCSPSDFLWFCCWIKSYIWCLCCLFLFFSPFLYASWWR